MSLFILLLVAVAAALLVGYLATAVARFVQDDGAHGVRRTPPSSHHADHFDPRSRLA